MSIGPRSSCSVKWTVVELRFSCSTIGRTVVIGPVSNWPVIGWTVVGYSWINTGGCSWINTGSIRGEAAADAVAAVV